MSFGGVVWMSFDPGMFEQGTALMLIIASAFLGALGLIAIKRVSGIKPLELQAWFAMSSWPTLLFMTLMLESGQMAAVQSAGALTWLSVAYVALLSSLVGHTGYYYLIQRYPVSSVAPVTVLSPLFSVMFSTTLLKTALTPRLIAGGTVTLLGVLIIAAREKKIVDTGS
jgi:O-acetylserine/cysteine efflux transporter